jgi:Uma2 family endonuclease
MPDVLEPTYWTAEMVRALPDDGHRYEVVHGELLVTPAPRAPHQLVVQRLHVSLAEYLKREPAGYLWLSPADISWDPGTLVQPDLFVVDPAESRTLDWASMQHLLFVIEVLSPTTARYDRFTKRRRYQEAGVPEYWIVDPERQVVEIWHPGDQLPRTEPTQATWLPVGAERGFTVSLAELLAPL